MTDLQELRRLLDLGILRMEPNGDIVAIEIARVRTQVPTKVANLHDLLDQLQPSTGPIKVHVNVEPNPPKIFPVFFEGRLTR